MSEERPMDLRPWGIAESVSPASDSGSHTEPSPTSVARAGRGPQAQPTVAASGAREPVEAGRAKSAQGQHPPMDLRIGELVLEGFSPGDRYRIGEAMESELARLFAERGAPASLSAGSPLSRMDGGAIQIATDTKPAEIGIHLARSIYRGLTR